MFARVQFSQFKDSLNAVCQQMFTTEFVRNISNVLGHFIAHALIFQLRPTRAGVKEKYKERNEGEDWQRLAEIEGERERESL